MEKYEKVQLHVWTVTKNSFISETVWFEDMKDVGEWLFIFFHVKMAPELRKLADS